jgi:hypothetical protein
MIKAIILGCAICGGAGGTLVWLKSGSDAAQSGIARVSPNSIQDMQSAAHMKDMPTQAFDAY